MNRKKQYNQLVLILCCLNVSGKEKNIGHTIRNASKSGDRVAIASPECLNHKVEGAY